MGNNIQLWNSFLSKVLEMPGIKIDRQAFLKTKLINYCTEAQVQIALSSSPLKVLSRQDVDRIAHTVIGSHVKQVTTISAIAGIPGGLAMFGTIPADILQYYYHVFVLSQKLAYLYGYPDLLDENGNVTDDTVNLLTLFVGVMMGAAAANNAIRAVAKRAAERAAKKIPQMSLTKGAIYPIVKKIAIFLGYKMNKDIFGKGVGKVIPFLGGIVSGVMTYASFKPGAKRLQKRLQADMEFFYRSMDMDGTELHNNNSSYTDVSYEDIPESSVLTDINYLRIIVLIDIAHIDNAITENERMYINSKIEKVDLTDEEKLELINYLKDGTVPSFSFDLFRNNNKEGIHLLTDAIQLLKLDNRFTLGEKLYIKKIGKELGFSPEELKEYME